jgi:hypothetical protein
MGLEPPSGRRSAFGDEVVPVTRTEEESERLSRNYARQAQQDHPAVVTHIRTAFDLVLDDLGVGPGSGVVEALWMPSEMEHEIRPWTFHNSHPDLPGEWWRGLIYLHGQRQLTIEIDASRPDTQLPYYIAFAIQDSIQEEFGRPRPACPLHGHALRPSGTLTGSVWECPDDGKLWWCRMGEYRQALTSD